jgi:hypothetical protein
MNDTDWFDTQFLEDGSVKICYQNECGWITSAHLIIPKALQLRQAYNQRQNEMPTL